tara:strand:+ start:3443 stop:4300 length:858 start_codon:yes stop_codon:yes gene_type:complete
MDNTIDTAVETDNIQPVTDSANPVENTEESVSTETKSDNNTTPQVENRDGKLFVDGVRVYTRDDTNRIAASAKNEVEKNILNDLNVDSIDQVKKVVSTLQEVNPQEGSSLNVDSLRDAVRKREATVEELKAQVTSLKTDLLLKDHMGQLQSAMPSNWTPTQKESVVKLMKADGMLAVEGDTFAIRNGNDFLTVDGETPDYAKAVEIVGKERLGLSFGKKGVDVQYGETSSESNSTKSTPLNEDKIVSDAEYRAAYRNIRRYQPNIQRSTITDAMVKAEMKRAGNK